MRVSEGTEVALARRKLADQEKNIAGRDAALFGQDERAQRVSQQLAQARAIADERRRGDGARFAELSATASGRETQLNIRDLRSLLQQGKVAGATL